MNDYKLVYAYSNPYLVPTSINIDVQNRYAVCPSSNFIRFARIPTITPVQEVQQAIFTVTYLNKEMFISGLNSDIINPIITITDVSGSTIYTGTINLYSSVQNKIPITLTTGVYFIKIQTPNPKPQSPINNFVQKFIVEGY